MSRAPIDIVLDRVDWKVVEQQEDDPASNDGIPYATHWGEMDFMGHTLRCYRLSDGRAVINADDLDEFFKDFAQ